MIEMKNVSFSYQETVLKSVTFRVETGELAFLTGKSGEGKTTIFELFSAQLLSEKGEVIIDELTIDSENTEKVKKKIARLTQPPRLISDKTVKENLSYVLEYRGESQESIDKEVSSLLERLQLFDRERHYPDELSGGEQSRLGLGLAIIKDCPIMLIDEPTANLDPMLGKEIVELLSDLAKAGKTVLVSTHDLSVISKDCKVIEILEGNIEVKQ